MHSADAERVIQYLFPLERLPAHTQELLKRPAGRKELSRWPQYAGRLQVGGAAGEAAQVSCGAGCCCGRRRVYTCCWRWRWRHVLLGVLHCICCWRWRHVLLGVLHCICCWRWRHVLLGVLHCCRTKQLRMSPC